MRPKFASFPLLIFFLIYIAFTSCERQDRSFIDVSEKYPIIENSDSTAFVRFELKYGENETKSDDLASGYKTENGFDNENGISNIIVVFVPASENNVNDFSEVMSMPIKSWIEFYEEDYINSGIITTVTKAVKNIALRKYHVIVVTNYQKLLTMLSEGMTVKDILELQESDLWKTNSDNSKREFIMSNINDDIIDFSIMSTRANPLKINININRIASRIDIGIYNNKELNIANTYLLNENGENLARVRITDVKAANILSESSYIIKRGASDKNSPISYFYNEAISKGYILDPWSRYKTDNAINGGIDIDGEKKDIGYLYKNYLSKDFDFSGSSLMPEKGEFIDSDGKSYFILDYAMENCSDFSSIKKAFTTCLVYKAKFMPYKLYDYSDNAYIISDNDNEDVDFYYSNSDKRACISLKGLMYPYFKPGIYADVFTPGFTISNSWKDVRDYISIIKDNDILGYKNYLNKILNNAVVTYKSESDKLTQSDLLNISWNSFEKSLTKTILESNGVYLYKNCDVYYHYWIEHEKNSSLDVSNTKYAIVRNNIYRMTVQSVKSIGYPEPYDPGNSDVEEPGDKSLIIKVSVLGWNIINHPDIIM